MVNIMITMALIFVANLAFAESQPSATTSLVKNHSEQNITKKSQNICTLISKGTDESPIVVKLANPPKGDLINSGSTDKNENKPSGERWIIWLTAGLVVTGLLQWDSLRRTVKEMNAATQVSKAAADAAKKSADIAEKALTMVERPYVFVSSVSQFQIDPNRVGGLTPFINYEIANYGKTPAHIYAAQAIVTIDLDEVEHPFYIEIPSIIGVGERVKLQLEFPDNMLQFSKHGTVATPELTSTDDIYFKMMVTYRGFLEDIYYENSFWVYDRNENKFTQRNGPYHQRNL